MFWNIAEPSIPYGSDWRSAGGHRHELAAYQATQALLKKKLYLSKGASIKGNRSGRFAALNRNFTEYPHAEGAGRLHSRPCGQRPRVPRVGEEGKDAAPK